MKSTKVIAFYLPQFHPMPENDLWWGKGHTEWRSVAKAKPLFKGHKQPKIPANLGFYDLRLEETRFAQAELAQKAGISAFCYYYYWFEGKRIMNEPLDRMLKTGRPDFPFCLAWANHDWYNKGWITSNKRIELKPKLLIKQGYGGVKDYTDQFYTYLSAFKDERYFKTHGKLLFMIYAADLIPDLEIFISTWQHLADKEGLPGFYFITHMDRPHLFDKLAPLYQKGIDAVNLSYLHVPFEHTIKGVLKNNKICRKLLNFWESKISFSPITIEYAKAIKYLDTEEFEKENIIPTIIPNWDHTPRSGRFGKVYKNSSPFLFGQHTDNVLKRLKKKGMEDRIVFLKSWNEWGEGNYLEPDEEYGEQYIETLRNCLDKFDL